MRRALFVDRDGTIIRDTGYPCDPAEVEVLPGIVDLLRGYQSSGHLLIIVSNQSGIGRKIITEDQYRNVHRSVLAALSQQGIHVTDSYFCPHTPEDGCFCRKPRPGLLLLAAHDHDVDLRESTMLGDKLSDIDAGAAAGCRTLRWPAAARSGLDLLSTK